MGSLCRSFALPFALHLGMVIIILFLHCCEAVEISITDGYSETGKTFDTLPNTILNLRGLDNTRKVTSDVTLTDCVVTKSHLIITGGSTASPETFATSPYITLLRMRIETYEEHVNVWLQIQSLPPNAYLLFTHGTSYKYEGWRTIMMQTGWESNTTMVIEHSYFDYLGAVKDIHAIRSFSPPSGSVHEFYDNCVLHVRNFTTRAAMGVLHIVDSPFPIREQSALVFEDVTCIDCSESMLDLGVFSILKESAFILRGCRNLQETTTKSAALLKAKSVTVDETSLLSFIDIENGYGTPAFRFNISLNTSIEGPGTIVISRLTMQRSGLHILTPTDNTNFWVSARMVKGQDMTVAELKEQMFNVNDAHVYNWDGTGSDGVTCVPVGDGIPGRATYTLVDGKCVGKCNEGYVEPACTAPAQSKCLVDNCELCYRITKTKCMMCAPYTTYENGDTICRCPISICRICSSANTCTMCELGYNVTADGTACIRCSKTVPDCFHCSVADKCDQCAPSFSVSNDGNTCYACNDPHCERCTAELTCGTCSPSYSLSAVGKANNRCIPCHIEHCMHCSDDNLCSQCTEGYTLSENKKKCARCAIKNCKRCDTDDKCADCPAQHTATPDGKHCYRCTMPGCLTCDGEDACGSCDTKYTLVGKTCAHCDIPNCEACTSDGVCDSCAPNHTLLNNKCVPCSVDGCTSCSAENHCSECANGNPPIDGICVACTLANCGYCNATESCAECKPRYSLIPSATGGDELECISCNIDNCASCLSPDVCGSCKDSTFYLSKDKKKCTECDIDGCTRCDEPGVCAVCSADSVVSYGGSACIPCNIGNCSLCSTANKCAMCECGMVPTDKGTECVTCHAANCKACDYAGNGNKCVECVEGYVRNDGDQTCKKAGLASWVVLIIVVVVIAVVIVIAYISVWYYRRYQGQKRQKELDAAERRNNRMSRMVGRSTNNTLISVVDLSDIVAAASGVRDDTRGGAESGKVCSSSPAIQQDCEEVNVKDDRNVTMR